MKLMKKVANRDHSPTKAPPKPSGPSVAGARSSKTRIVIAMAKTPSIRVSRRFFGSPCAVGLGASARLPPTQPHGAEPQSTGAGDSPDHDGVLSRVRKSTVDPESQVLRCTETRC